MSIGRPIPDSEVTPWSAYLNRRQWLRAATLAGSVVATGSIYRAFNGNPLASKRLAESAEPLVEAPAEERSELDEPLTSEWSVTHYNNFYEFTTRKEGVAAAAARFQTTGWEVEIAGLVRKPGRYNLDDLHRISPAEERIYRMRCVEAWSMVIPWMGIPLSRIIEAVEPTSEARFVAFETLFDPKRMPGQRTAVLEWPYVEGLRMDEAMHPLTILATGLYGRELPPQDGAPIRLVVPWKYGFKGIKSIVKISFVEAAPPATWNRVMPHEYGFFANVNPEVDHPRWSQATEQRIGEFGRRKTLMFNGYEEQVAGLYTGMDLTVHF